MPPCGGVPYSSASTKKPNRSLRLLVRDAEQLEDQALQRLVVDPDAAAADLAAVQHQVVGARAHAARVGLEQAGVALERRVNGWCMNS